MISITPAEYHSTKAKMKSIKRLLIKPVAILPTAYFFLSSIILSSVTDSKFISIPISGFFSLSILFLLTFFNKRGTRENLKISSHYWTFLLAFIMSLSFANHLYRNSDFSAYNFDDRTIGIVTFFSLNASIRTMLYIKIAVLAFVTLIAFNLAFSLVNCYLTSKVSLHKLKSPLSFLISLSLVSIFSQFIQYINGQIIFITITKMVNLIILLLLSTTIFGVITKERFKNLGSLLLNHELFILSLIFPIILFFSRWGFISSGSFIFTNSYFFIYLIAWLLFYFACFIFARVFSKKYGQNTVINAILVAFVPLMLIPLLLPLLNEFQYYLVTQGINTPLSNIFRVGIITMYLAGGLTFIYFLARIHANKMLTLISNIYFPLVIITIALLNVHSNFIDIPNGLDTFHHGENLLPVQQLFSFGKIPFIDLYPTHGLSYMYSQALYATVFGFQPITPWLGLWMMKAFEMVLLYFILKIIVNRYYGVLVITFLPVAGIFGGSHFVFSYNNSLTFTYYFAAFLPALAIGYLYKNLNMRKLILIWLVTLFMLLWRIDFGLATLTAVLTLFFIKLLSQSSLDKGKIFFISLAKTFIYVYLPFIIVVNLITFLKQINLWELLKLNLQLVNYLKGVN